MKTINPEKKALVRVYKDYASLSIRQIGHRTGVSKSSVQRILNNTGECKNSKRIGRPRKITKRVERQIIRVFKAKRDEKSNVTAKEVLAESDLGKTVSVRTVSRTLNRNGYYFLQARKKGLLSNQDKKKRLRYARRMYKVLKEHPNFFTEHISFYLDGVSFVHKTNPYSVSISPKNRIWRRKGEGLTYTAKGSKNLPGGKRVHVMVAIAYSQGVILKYVYEKMDGKCFAEIIDKEFNMCFAKAGPKFDRQRLFVMDNCPCQNAKIAKQALEKIEAKLHNIPSRSPDLNPIENMFHKVKDSLDKEALDKKIYKESFDEFKNRVLRCLGNIETEYINNTISSLPKRIKDIIKSKGKRIKY